MGQLGKKKKKKGNVAKMGSEGRRKRTSGRLYFGSDRTNMELTVGV